MSDEQNFPNNKEEHLQLTTKIVAAYVGNNSLPTDALPDIIQTVYSTLQNLGCGSVPSQKQKPAVPIKKSYTEDYIICLEDGKKLKMLKRYLRTRYGMTPDDYRAKWQLPTDYPMVAPSYASKRSEYAKQAGLGKKR